MTPEAQRIAIAEACGWKPAKSTGIIYHGWQKEGVSKFRHTYQLPDYLSDLNAMNEAEKLLTDEQFLNYFEYLDMTVRKNTGTKGIRPPCCASAGDRAEAFLRALDLWDDSK